MSNVVFATSTSQVQCNGVPVMVHAGSHWLDDDPVVVAYPSMFSTDARHGLSHSVPIDEGVVEEATAAPGEMRRVGGRRGE